MDVFRMLSRSTTLTKTAAATGNIWRTPSSGEARNPQLFGDWSGSPEVPRSAEGQYISRKRKRREGSASRSAELPTELDFFNEENGPSKEPSTKPSFGQSEISAGVLYSEKPVARGETGGISPEPLSEGDCRRVLKGHKLKITLLGNLDYATTSIAPQTTQQKMKKRRKRLGSEVPPNTKTPNTQLFPQPLTNFSELRNKYGISRRLADNIETQGYAVPTEVQLGSLPLLLGSDVDAGLVTDLEGSKIRRIQNQDTKIDLLTVAPTGSGKTLAFLIPVLNGLIRDPRNYHGPRSKVEQPRAIIVAPTKELATQIVNEGRKLAHGTGIRISGMRKGLGIVSQPEVNSILYEENHDSEDNDSEHEDIIEGGQTLRHRSAVKSDILVSTPMLLLHALTGNEAHPPSHLPGVRYLVLDEADVLLDPLFRAQTLGIWHACVNHDLRVSLWSATMGSNIEQLAQSTIRERDEILGLSDTTSQPKLIRLVVGLKDSAIPNIAHKLVYAATESGKLLALRQLLHPNATTIEPGPSLRPPFLVFTQTIPRAVALHSELLYDIPLEAGGSSRIAVLHSALSDTVRDGIMTQFRNGEIWILITTDLLARGVDFRGINGVVNYDVPNSGAAYIHRVGRTGRAGREGGVAVTLYTKEDIPYVKNVANIIAASEKQRGIKGTEETRLQKWLLDALPKPSKKDKKELKRHGVEARRAHSGGKDVKGRSKMRISTKSGFDRRMQNNRQGALKGSRKRQADEDGFVENTLYTDAGNTLSGSEWSGLDD
ncbi:MAG: RNA-dependent ATPase rok1 [Candelina mexicana]|nr:MAG: RNA-dependent ATPase rok1 [Candelina mexicana]